MYQKLLHTRGLRLLGGLLGSPPLAAAINVFIVPQGLYGGGAYGLCQVIRTLVLRALDLELPFDLAGVLVFLREYPAVYAGLPRAGTGILPEGRHLYRRQLPVSGHHPLPCRAGDPRDMLTSCMVGGILVGFSAGLVLGGAGWLLHRRAGHSGTVSQQKGQPLHRGAVLHHLQRRTVHPVLLPVRRHHRHLLRYI